MNTNLTINYKNLDYEIETINLRYAQGRGGVRSTIRISITRLKRELQRINVVSGVRSTIRISITRLKLMFTSLQRGYPSTINYKNLDYEIETLDSDFHYESL